MFEDEEPDIINGRQCVVCESEGEYFYRSCGIILCGYCYLNIPPEWLVEDISVKSVEWYYEGF